MFSIIDIETNFYSKVKTTCYLNDEIYLFPNQKTGDVLRKELIKQYKKFKELYFQAYKTVDDKDHLSHIFSMCTFSMFNANNWNEIHDIANMIKACRLYNDEDLMNSLKKYVRPYWKWVRECIENNISHDQLDNYIKMKKYDLLGEISDYLKIN